MFDPADFDKDPAAIADVKRCVGEIRWFFFSTYKFLFNHFFSFFSPQWNSSGMRKVWSSQESSRLWCKSICEKKKRKINLHTIFLICSFVSTPTHSATQKELFPFVLPPPRLLSSARRWETLTKNKHKHHYSPTHTIHTTHQTQPTSRQTQPCRPWTGASLADGDWLQKSGTEWQATRSRRQRSSARREYASGRKIWRAESVFVGGQELYCCAFVFGLGCD